MLLSGEARLFKPRPQHLIANDQVIFDELACFEFDQENDDLGPIVPIEKLISLYPALRYRLSVNYDHISSYRLHPKAIQYTDDYSYRQTSIGSQYMISSSIASIDGVMQLSIDSIVVVGSMINSRILSSSIDDRRSTAVISTIDCLLAVVNKTSFDAGMTIAVSRETELRLGSIMTKMLHDMVPVVASRKIGEAFIANEVCVRKGKLYQKPAEKCVYCVSKGSFAISREIKPGEFQSKAFVKKKELMSWRAGYQAPPTRLPRIDASAKKYGVELCMNNKLNNLLLRKKENLINRDIIAEIGCNELIGVIDAMTDFEYPYDIIAIEDSCMMSMSAIDFKAMIEDSPYFCKFVKWHVKQAISHGEVVYQSKQRLSGIMTAIVDQLSISERSSRLSSKLSMADDSISVNRSILDRISDVRCSRVNDIHVNHNRLYMQRYESTIDDDMIDFANMFKKHRKRIVYRKHADKCMTVDAIDDRCIDVSRMIESTIDPNINLTTIDRLEISVSHASDMPTTAQSDKMADLKDKLEQICCEPGGRSLAEYLSKLLLNRPAKAKAPLADKLSNKKRQNRSYDDRNRDMRKRIFESVVDKTSDRDGESVQLDFSIKPIDLGRKQARSSDPRRGRQLNFSAKPVHRAKSSMFRHADEVITNYT